MIVFNKHLMIDLANQQVIFIDGTGTNYFINNKNIHSFENAKAKIILKNTYLDSENIGNLNGDGEKRVSLLHVLLSDKLSHYFKETKNYECENPLLAINPYTEYPNLRPLQSILKKINTDKLGGTLFYQHHWVKKENNKHLSTEQQIFEAPFLFMKKEHFSFFKSLPEQIIQNWISSNYPICSNKTLHSIPLLCTVLCYPKNKNLLQTIQKLNENNYQQFLSEFINVLNGIYVFVNKINFNSKVSKIFYQDDVLGIVFSWFLQKIIDLLNEQSSLDYETVKNFTIDFKSTFSLIFEIISQFGNMSLFLPEVSKFFLEIKNKKNTKLDKINSLIYRQYQHLDYLAYLNSSFLSENAPGYTDLPIVFKTNSFVFENHLFTPLIYNSDYHSEGTFMNNCVATYYGRNLLKSKNKTFILCFHIVPLNDVLHLDSESKFENFTEFNISLSKIREVKSPLHMLGSIKINFFKNSCLNQIDNENLTDYFQVNLMELKKSCNKLVPDKQAAMFTSFINSMNTQSGKTIFSTIQPKDILKLMFNQSI